MKIKLTLNHGNRGLLPSEVGVVDIVNDKLRRSAERHGKKLKPASVFVVQSVDTQGSKVQRAAAGDSEPELPLTRITVHG